MLDLQHIFNAAVVLLLHQMVFSNVVNTDTIGIRWVIGIFNNEARTECASPVSSGSAGPHGGDGLGFLTGYASDCLAVLNDLAVLVAQIRSLRFKGSEHTTTGVDEHICLGGGGSDAGDGTGYPTGTLGNSPLVIRNEQIVTNLSLENPFQPASIYGTLPMAYSGHSYMDMGAGVGVVYTNNHKELERWVHEGQQVCGMPMQLGGYMGV